MCPVTSNEVGEGNNIEPVKLRELMKLVEWFSFLLKSSQWFEIWSLDSEVHVLSTGQVNQLASEALDFLDSKVETFAV